MQIIMKTDVRGKVHSASVNDGKTKYRFELEPRSNGSERAEIFRFYEGDHEFFRMTCQLDFCDAVPDLPWCHFTIDLQADRWDYRRSVRPVSYTDLELETVENGKQSSIRLHPGDVDKQLAGVPGACDTMPPEVARKLEAFAPVVEQINAFYHKELDDFDPTAGFNLTSIEEGSLELGKFWKKFLKGLCIVAATVGGVACCVVATPGCAVCTTGAGSLIGMCANG